MTLSMWWCLKLFQTSQGEYIWEETCITLTWATGQSTMRPSVSKPSSSSKECCRGRETHTHTTIKHSKLIRGTVHFKVDTRNTVLPHAHFHYSWRSICEGGKCVNKTSHSTEVYKECKGLGYTCGPSEDWTSEASANGGLSHRKTLAILVPARFSLAVTLR